MYKLFRFFIFMNVSIFRSYKTNFILKTHISPSKKHLDVKVFLGSLDSLFSYKREGFTNFYDRTKYFVHKNQFHVKTPHFHFPLLSTKQP